MINTYWMGDLFRQGEQFQILSGDTGVVTGWLGSGGQGEVYKVAIGGTELALKWYFPSVIRDDLRLRSRLEQAIAKGPPSSQYLWPIDLAAAPNKSSFGYVMPLMRGAYSSIEDLGRSSSDAKFIDPSWKMLSIVGFRLAEAYRALHQLGFCYMDVSSGNVSFNPKTGDILVCDNDNVEYANRPVRLGTAGYMAPEVQRGGVFPSPSTDLYSISVLMFQLFMIQHPLEGANVLQYRVKDDGIPSLFGTDPVFIFDPDTDRNRPLDAKSDPRALTGWGVGVQQRWNSLPEYAKQKFIQAFTIGLHEPLRRVRLSEWMETMARLYDEAYYCARCGKTNFYDITRLTTDKTVPNCPFCGQTGRLPFRARINGRRVVMLNHDTKLFAHHLNPDHPIEFDRPLAEMAQHPQNNAIWGLRNLSQTQWQYVSADGDTTEVPDGKSALVASGTKLMIGNTLIEVTA